MVVYDHGLYFFRLTQCFNGVLYRQDINAMKGGGPSGQGNMNDAAH